uniref:Nucleolar protein 58-like n=1 Tax=Tanacetum cinerariifolium TaxID=118510 RepID=A0A6L2NUC4_TANCI|nr:nucleolar protein 58-like [Tanacetum cinerariifolium]
MSRDVLTVGSTMRIQLLYQGEYSQWSERFINYLEEQTDGEAMINCIKNGDQPLPRVTQVSIAGTLSTEQPPLKEKSMCNKTAKDLWVALARHMLGSEYGEQDRKAAVLYEYETFKATEGELLLDTNIRYLQNKNLMDINIDALYNILKQNQRDVNDAMGLKKKTVVVTSDPLALIAEKTKMSKRKEKVVDSLDFEGSDADDFSELKKITALLAKAFNRRKFYSKPTNNNLRTSSASQCANKIQECVKSDDKKFENKDDEKKRDMNKVKCYNCKKEGHFAKDCKKAKVNDYEYYKTKILLAKKDKDKQVLLAEDHAWMELRSDSDQEINANMVFMTQIKKVLSDSEASSLSADDKISEVSYYLSESESKSEVINLGYTPMFLTHSDEALEIEKFKRERENKIEFAYDYGNLNASYVNEKINLSDDYFQEIINPDFEKIDSPFQQTSSLKPYVSTVILKKIIIDLEDEVVSLLEKEKKKLKTIESLKSKDVETGVESSKKVVSETENESENDCQEIEKAYDSEKNPNVIAPGMFKLSVSQSASPIFVTKTSCAPNGVENLDTLSSVRRPKPSGVMWMKNGVLILNALCNARMNASVDVNDLFVFDDASIRKSHVSKMPFRKNPSASLIVSSRSKLNKSLPRIMHCLDLSLDHRFGMFKAYDRDVVIGSMAIRKFTMSKV